MIIITCMHGKGISAFRVDTNYTINLHPEQCIAKITWTLLCKTLGTFQSAITGLQAKPAITVNAMHICRVTTRMHKINTDYTQLRNIHVYARSADLVHTKKVQGKKHSLTVNYDQWWVSRVIGPIARPTHYSSWKGAIAVYFVHRELVKKRRRQRWSANVAKTLEQSVFNESHTMHILKTPNKA